MPGRQGGTLTGKLCREEEALSGSFAAREGSGHARLGGSGGGSALSESPGVGHGLLQPDSICRRLTTDMHHQSHGKNRARQE